MDLEKLRALAASKASARRAPTSGEWWSIGNITDSGETAVYLYGEIGDPWDGVSDIDFIQAFAGVSGPIALHINSPGGDVFAGMAIYATIAARAGEVTAYVDGLAGSSASFILQAAGRRVLAPNARVMLHMPSGGVLGMAADMRRMADLLDNVAENIASIYAERSGAGDTASWLAVMQEDAGNGRWFTAQAAVSAGLADSIGFPVPDQPAEPVPEPAPEPTTPAEPVPAEQEATACAVTELSDSDVALMRMIMEGITV